VSVAVAGGASAGEGSGGAIPSVIGEGLGKRRKMKFIFPGVGTHGRGAVSG
jgi:hypothetical protein